MRVVIRLGLGKNIGVGMVFLEALKSRDQIGMQAPEKIRQR